MNQILISYDLSACVPWQHTKFKKIVCGLSGFAQSRVNAFGAQEKLPGSTLMYTGSQPESKVLQMLKQAAKQCNIDKYNFVLVACKSLQSAKTN